MIPIRSSSLNRDHAATSAKVRKHPRQRPLSPSTTQTLMHGVLIGFGGPDGREGSPGEDVSLMTGCHTSRRPAPPAYPRGAKDKA